jgi:hypothetical protein
MPFPVDIQFVNDAESKLGVKFPAAFVVKMTALNGGSVTTGTDSWEIHPFLDTSDRKRLARTCNNVVRETEIARQWRGFPHDAVAIGSNGGGDRLVFLPDDNSPTELSPRVFWWDHETGEIHCVADDFADL